MSKPRFDPDQDFQVIEKPRFDPDKPYKETMFDEPPRTKESVSQEKVMHMIKSEIGRALANIKPPEKVEKRTDGLPEDMVREVVSEISKALSNIKIPEKVIEKHTVKEMPKEVIREVPTRDTELEDEMRKLKEAVKNMNFVIPKRYFSKEKYEVTNLDELRSFDAATDTVDNLYKVVGTLINDLRKARIIQ